MSLNPGENAMNLDELSASDLTAIDLICMEFERCFDSDAALTVEQSVKKFLDQQKRTPRRELVELLRQELLAIESELQGRRQASDLAPSSFPTPFQSKPGAMDWDAVEQSHPIVSAGDSSFVGSLETEWMPGASEAPPLSPIGTAEPTAPREDLADTSSRGDQTDAIQSGPPKSPANPELPEQSIGPYTIGRVLARGGMGIVYRAFDTRLDRPVAIKMLGFPNLSPSDPKRAELVERFEREAKAVAALSHPNIVELFDVGVIGNLPYAVMEFLSGVTLADQLVNGPMSVEETRQVGMQIAGALATAHAAGVIHRDLKPQNVMLVDNKHSNKDAGPRVKLVDFGLSRVGDSTSSSTGSESHQTRSGMILGTPGYMSPEQARGESATNAADMFGFGCVLYEVFYGRPAIPGATPADRLAGTLQGSVEFDEARCETSQLLCELISECLNKDPAGRPSATDVYGRLRQFDVGGAWSVSGQRPRTSENGLSADGLVRRHVLTTVAGGIMGALVGGFSIADSRDSLGTIQSIAVLTLRDLKSRQQSVDRNGLPLEDRKIADGEILASALVNELTAVDGLAVLPYRPQTADTREQFVKLGDELGVDAFLTGSYESQTHGQQNFWVVNWQLISATDGSLLGGKQFVTEQAGEANGAQFLAQSAVASDIAKQIGRVLVTSSEKRQRPDPMAYGCMMKGHAYADADSTTGLRQALMCYRHAHQEDPRLSEPLAAMAVASLNLAARSDSADESLEHLEKARSSMTQALDLDPNSMLARLAEAMLEWQSLSHYDQAYQLFADLHRKYKFNWQVQYQRGLLLAALGHEVEAKDAMRTASKLNPMSTLVKTDRCRVDWFFGWGPRAELDALRYRAALSDDNPARKLAIGFLVDYYEDRGDFAKAAAQLGSETVASNSPEDSAPEDSAPEFSAPKYSAPEYFEYRQTTLVELPYGPFGNSLNQAILDLRKDSAADVAMLGALDESGATMFPLLLARHPAFFDLRASRAAAAYLPSLDYSTQVL